MNSSLQDRTMSPRARNFGRSESLFTFQPEMMCSRSLSAGSIPKDSRSRRGFQDLGLGGIEDTDIFCSRAYSVSSFSSPQSSGIHPRPRIFLTPLLSRADWAHNMLVRPHNAIRKMVQQAYTMIDAFFLKPAAVNFGYAENFFSWWYHVASLLTQVHAALEDVVVRRLDSGSTRTRNTLRLGRSTKCQLSRLPPCVSKKRIRTMAGIIEDIVDSFAEIHAQLYSRGPLDSMARCMKEMEGFRHVLGFYHDVESHLPKVLTRTFSFREGRRLESDIWQYLSRDGDFRSLHHAMLLHAMDGEDAQTVRRTVLSMTSRIHCSLQGASFEQDHLKPARQIFCDLADCESVSGSNTGGQLTNHVSSPLVPSATLFDAKEINKNNQDDLPWPAVTSSVHLRHPGDL